MLPMDKFYIKIGRNIQVEQHYNNEEYGIEDWKEGEYHAALRYDWVNYSTAIGVEQLILNHIHRGNHFFTERIKDSQVEYVNRIYKSDAKKFYEYK